MQIARIDSLSPASPAPAARLRQWARAAGAPCRAGRRAAGEGERGQASFAAIPRISWGSDFGE